MSANMTVTYFEPNTTIASFKDYTYLTSLFAIAHLFYAIPSECLYIFLYKFISSDKELQSRSFYRIYRALCVSCSVYFVVDYVFWRLGYTGLLDAPVIALFGIGVYTYWLTPYYFSLYYLMTLNQLAIILVVVNRMTCVIAPMSYEKVWRRYFWLAQVWMLVLPVLMFPYLLVSPIIVYHSPNGGIGMDYKRLVTWSSNSRTTALTGLTTLLFIIICTTITVILIKRIDKNNKKAELQLIYSAGVMSVAVIPFCLNQICFLLLMRTVSVSTVLHLMRPFCSDLLLFSIPWSFLALNAQFNQFVVSKFRKPREDGALFTKRTTVEPTATNT